jgi:hypothetical protein
MQRTDDETDVKQRAVDNIMKLIHSQLNLERKQAKMDAKVCVSRVWRSVCPDRSAWFDSCSGSEPMVRATVLPERPSSSDCAVVVRPYLWCGSATRCKTVLAALKACTTALQDKDGGKAATRMADLDDTIEKLVAVAKRKGYVDQDCTVESLKAEAAKGKEKEVQDDAVSLMTAMKKNLDAQTTAVRFFRASGAELAVGCA